VKFITDFNLNELRAKDPRAFTKLADLSEDVGVLSYCEFVNKVISRFYELLYEDKLPRVTKEMRKSLQLSEGKTTGDWFLYNDVMVIRVYGFWGFPYVFPALLTPESSLWNFLGRG